MAYTVLARRYRPQTFDDLIGQEAVARTIRNAINSDRVAHAYLFTGTRGVGKTTTARLLAKALNCEKGPTADPCGKCDSCRRTQEGDDIDVIEIDGASNTGVDSVRELRANAIYAPARSRFKIYIIDEVHMLSSGAFNALLKTLEEPPEHVKFIFATTDPQKVPGTIHSRCQRFDFRSVPAEVIADYLAKLCKKEKIKADKDALRIIAREGRGSVRDSLTILDQAITLCDGDVTLGPVLESLGLADSQRYFDLTDAVADADVGKALAQLDTALNEGAEPGEFLDRLMDHLRGLLLVKMAGRDAPGLEATDEEREGLVKQAARFDAERLTVAMELVGESRMRLRGLSHGRPLVELAVVQLATLPDFASIRETIERLQGGSGDQGGAGQPTPSGPAEKKNDEVTAAPRRKAADAEDADSGAAEPVFAVSDDFADDAPSADPAACDEIPDFPADEPGEADTVNAAEAWTGDLHEPAEPARGSPPAAAAPSSGAADGADSGGEATADGSEASHHRPLTQVEQRELFADPKVRRIMEVFDGRVVDARRRRGGENG